MWKHRHIDTTRITSPRMKRTRQQESKPVPYYTDKYAEVKEGKRKEREREQGN